MQDDRWKETGIVYCMTKKDAEALSDFLVENKVCYRSTALFSFSVNVIGMVD